MSQENDNEDVPVDSEQVDELFEHGEEGSTEEMDEMVEAPPRTPSLPSALM